MLDSAQLSAVMKTGGSARENNKNPVHWRGAPMVRGLIGNQVFGKLNCRFESCSLRLCVVGRVVMVLDFQSRFHEFESRTTLHGVNKSLHSHPGRISPQYKEGAEVTGLESNPLCCCSSVGRARPW